MDWKQELFNRLDALGQKLGVTAGHLWMVLVRQGVATGIADVVGAVLSLMGAIALALVCRYCIRKSPDAGYGNEWAYGTVGVIAAVAAVMLTVCFACNLYSGILELYNPEYFALTEILKALSAVK